MMTPEIFDYRQLKTRIENDSRVNVWHISLYSSLLNLSMENDYRTQFKVTRKKLMARAHFRSITTYHKCLNHLVDFGYIIYKPTYNSYEGSTIEILQHYL